NLYRRLRRERRHGARRQAKHPVQIEAALAGSGLITAGRARRYTRPLTGSSAPVMALAASLARNRITSANSSAVTHFLKSALGMLARLAGVSMVEGSTAL